MLQSEPPYIRDRKGTPQNLCDKDFAERSGELSGVICLKTLVLVGSALELFRKCFGTVRAIFWFWGSFLAPNFTGVLRPSRPEIPKKSQKGLPKPCGPESQKYSAKVLKWAFLDSSLILGPAGPGRTFRDLLGISELERLEILVCLEARIAPLDSSAGTGMNHALPTTVPETVE